jgi:hypothetical protein
MRIGFSRLVLVLCCSLFTACATLNKQEIKQLDKQDFEPIGLTPSYEPFNLRFDIIRQTKTKETSDSTETTTESSYHPIGFDLGNGLFFDINENIGIRLDHLLNFSPYSDFELTRYDRPKRNRDATQYATRNQSFYISHPPRRWESFQFKFDTHPDGVTVSGKRRFRYALIETEKAMKYAGKRRTLDAIYKMDNGRYYLNSKWIGRKFKQEGNKLIFAKKYIIEQSDDLKTIYIRNYGSWRHRPIYTITNSNNVIFIYDRNFSGYKLIKTSNALLVYKDRQLECKYVL